MFPFLKIVFSDRLTGAISKDEGFLIMWYSYTNLTRIVGHYAIQAHSVVDYDLSGSDNGDFQL